MDARLLNIIHLAYLNNYCSVLFYTLLVSTIFLNRLLALHFSQEKWMRHPTLVHWQSFLLCFLSLGGIFFNNDSSTFLQLPASVPVRSLFPFHKTLFYHSFPYSSDLVSALCGCQYVRSVWSWWNYRRRDGHLTGSHRHCSFPPPVGLGVLEIKIKKCYFQADS